MVLNEMEAAGLCHDHQVSRHPVDSHITRMTEQTYYTMQLWALCSAKAKSLGAVYYRPLSWTLAILQLNSSGMGGRSRSFSILLHFLMKLQNWVNRVE